MSEIRDRSMLVLELSLVALLATILLGMAEVLTPRIALVLAVLDVCLVALCITLYWASRGETGVGTW